MGNMEIELRREEPRDWRAVEELTREAFWNVYAPGCDEHYLAHILREADSFLPELDYVAECGGRLVGNIMYTRARLLLDSGGEADSILLFGPISVLPAFQGRGVGSRLIRETVRLAREMGWRAILIYGDPAYYSRFGFVPAEQYRIRDAENQYAAALQALELTPGALDGCAGRFLEAGAYEIDSAAAAAFDRGFPPKEKGPSPTQARFQELSGMRRDAEECRN